MPPLDFTSLPPAPDNLVPVASPTTGGPSSSLPSSVPPLPPAPANLVPIHPNPPREEGFFSGAGSGLVAGGRELSQLLTGRGFDPALAAQPEPERGFWNTAGYGLGHMLPSLGGALAGAAAGAATPVPGGALIGGATGMGAMSFAQGLVPNYRAAIQEGLSPEDALSRAYKLAAAEGVIGAATVPLFEVPLVKSVIGRYLFNTVVGMPAIGAVQRGVVEPAITGHPAPGLEQMAEGAAQDVVAGGILGAVMHPFTGHGQAKPQGEPRITFEEEPPPVPGQPVERPVAAGQPVPELPPAPPDLVPVATRPEPRPALPVEPEPRPALPVEPGPPPAVAPPAAEGPRPDVPPAPARAEPAPVGPEPTVASGGPEPLQPDPAAPRLGQPSPETRPVGAVPEPAARAPAGAPADRLDTQTTTAANRKLDTRFEVVEARDLKAATGDLQPRDREGRIHAERQQNEIYANFDPERLHASPEADRGAPIVDAENTLLTGNNRKLVLDRIHAGQEPGDIRRAQAYRDMIQRVTGQDTGRMEAPVLVRRIKGEMAPEDRVGIAREGNVSATQGMSAPETARLDAARLTPETMAKLNPEHDLDKASNRGFVQSWLKTVPETEHNTVLDDKGNLSPSGVQRLRAAILGKAYDDQGIIQRGLDTTHDEVRGISSALNDAAPAVSGLRAEIAAGKLDKRYDLSKSIADAVDRVRVAREKGQTLADITGQGDMFGGAKMPALTEKLVRAFYNPEGTRAASRTAIARTLKEYARLAREQGSDLLGTQTRPPDEILDQLINARARKGDQGELTPATPKAGTSEPVSAEPNGFTRSEPERVPEPAFAGPPPPEPTPFTTPVNKMNKTALVDELRQHGGFSTALKGDMPLAALRDLVERTRTERAAERAATEGQKETAPKVSEETATQRAGVGGLHENDLPPEGQGLKPGKQAENPEIIKKAIEPKAKAKRAPKALPPEKIEQAEKLRDAITRREKAPKTEANAKWLDTARKQLERLERRDTRDTEALESARSGDTRDTRDTGDTPAELAARQGFPAPTVREYGATKTFMDYQMADGTPVFRKIFADAGHDPNNVVNRPIREQVQIAAKQISQRFGFREIAVKGDLKNVRDQIMELYRAGHDVMNTLQYPYQALSLRGQIALELNGNLRQGTAHGVYRPGTLTVGIGGRSNSFMHEWTHAVDHYLSDRLIAHPKTGKLLSQNARANELVPGRHTVEDAFAKLINEMSFDQGDWMVNRLRLETEAAKTDSQGKPTAAAQKAQTQLDTLDAAGTKLRIRPSEYVRKSQDFDPARSKYWANTPELLARAHEAWVAHKARVAGVSPRGAAMEDIAHDVMTDRRLAMTYPKEADRLRIFRAFDDLHAAMRREQLFGLGKVAERSADAGIADPLLYNRMNPRDEPGVLQFVQRVKNDWANMRSGESWQRMKDPLLFDKSRPSPSTYTHKERTLDFFRNLTSSSLHMLKVMADRAPEEAKPFVRAIADKLGAEPGSGRYVGKVWEEQVRRTARPWTHETLSILENYGLKKMTPRQKEMLRHHLTTGENTFPLDADPRSTNVAPIPENIRKASGEIRHILDKAHDYARKAGLELGYVGGHFPRLVDTARVGADKRGFDRDATRLHKFIVDEAVNAAPDKADAVHDWWRAQGKELKANAPATLKAGMDEMTTLRRQVTLLERKMAAAGGTPDPAVVAARDTAKAKIDQLADQHADALSSWIGGMAADNWSHRILTGGAYDFDKKGPSTAFMRGRKLPAEADTFMRDWYHNDPTDVLPRYFEQVSRRANYAELFGAKHEIGESLIASASRAGLHTEDVHRIRGIIENVTGQTSYSNAPGMGKATSYIAAYASVALLPRAVFNQIHEPMAAALGVGDMRLAYDIFAKVLRNTWDLAGKHDKTAIVEQMGIINSPYHDSIINHRFVDYSDSPQAASFLSKFYQMTGLTHLTTAQKLATAEAGTSFMRRMVNRAATAETPGESKRVKNQRDDAQRLARELGINVDEGQHGRLADWMNKFDNMPSSDQLAAGPDGIGEVYAQALNRMVDRIIQDPTRAMRPMYSADPLGKLTFAFLSFNWAFQRNVLDAALGRIEHAYGRGKGDSKGLGGVAKGVMAATPETMGTLVKAASLVGAATLTKTLHHLLFNRDQWDKHEEEGDLIPWLIESGASSSGVGGTLDPLVQVFQHLRYDSSISNLVNGAPLAFLTENIQQIIAPHVLGEDEPTSNVATWKQAHAAYQMLGVPLAMYALTKLSSMFPGGIIAPVAGAAAWELSSADFKNAVANTLAGEKGTTIPKDGQEEKPEGEEEEAPEKEGKEKEAASPWATIGAGVADDVAVPMLRMFPLWGKAIGAAGLLGYGAYNFWDRAATFRDLPPPTR